MSTPTPTVREQTRVKVALHVVQRAADELEKEFPGRVRARELLAVGTFALYRAAKKFDDELSHDWVDYAYHMVHFAMIDALRVETKQERRKRAALKCADIFLATHRNDEVIVYDDDETIEGYLQGSVDALLVATFAAQVEEQKRIEAEDPVADAEEHRVACEALAVAMGTLTEEQREVLALVYRDQKTLEDAGQALGLSYATVRRRHTDALARLREELGKLGVDRAPPPLRDPPPPPSPPLRLVR